MDKKLSQVNCTIHEFNEYVSSVIKQYFSAKQTDDCQANNERVREIEDNEITFNENSAQVSQTIPTQMTAGNGNVEHILLTLQSSIQEMKADLKSHVQASEKQFVRMNDEFQCLKNKITIESKSLTQCIEDVLENSKNCESHVKTSATDIQKKLQSVP